MDGSVCVLLISLICVADFVPLLRVAGQEALAKSIEQCRLQLQERAVAYDELNGHTAVLQKVCQQGVGWPHT